MAALRRAGHRVRLVAPAASGAILLGPGEASTLAPLDGPDLAAVLVGAAPPAALHGDAALAVTRSADLLAALRAVVPRVLARDPRPAPGIHASHWFAAPLGGLGIDPAPDPPVLAFTGEEHVAARGLADRLPGQFLAIHPGSGSPRKNWPSGRFGDLIRARARGEPWLLVSGPADDDAAGALRRLPGAVPAPRLSPRVLGALLSRAGLFIGNDSGPSHLAAAAGAPTIAVFGPTDPGTWSPVGPLVETVASPDRRLDSLDVDTVLAASDRLLARRARSRTDAGHEGPARIVRATSSGD